MVTVKLNQCPFARIPVLSFYLNLSEIIKPAAIRCLGSARIGETAALVSPASEVRDQNLIDEIKMY